MLRSELTLAIGLHNTTLYITHAHSVHHHNNIELKLTITVTVPIGLME